MTVLKLCFPYQSKTFRIHFLAFILMAHLARFTFMCLERPVWLLSSPSFTIYKYFKETLPFWLLLASQFSNPHIMLLNKISKIMFATTTLTILYLAATCLLGYPFEASTGIDWQYRAPLIWAGVFAITYLTLTRKGITEFTALNYGVVSVFAGGWLYEIFAYPSMTGFSFFHPIFVFGVSIGFLMIPLLMFFLFKLRWKPDLISVLLLGFTLSYAYLFAANHVIPYPRIPTAIMLLYLAFRIPKRVA
jgi:hypothetical protein